MILRLKPGVKFYASVLLAACGVGYLVFAIFPVSPGHGLLTRSASSKGRLFHNRMVVFGDSSVDNNALQYTLGPGKSWTTWLCSQYDSLEENYAQSSPTSVSVIDSREIDQNQGRERQPGAQTTMQPLPDFRAQVQQYLENERRRTEGTDTETQKRRRKRTVYTIAFGLWDTWRSLHLPPAQARESIDRSIATLFEQLKLLVAYSAGEDTRVIIANAMDVTFLPAFNEKASSSSSAAAAVPRNRATFDLIPYWNMKLRQAMEKSVGPAILAVDLHSFVNDQLRMPQLWYNGYRLPSNHSKAGLDPKYPGVWANTKEPCFTGRRGYWGSLKYCRAHDKYVFWDSMHLSSQVQKRFADEIYQDMKFIWLRN